MEYFLVAFTGLIFGIFVIIRETRNIKREHSIYLINIFGYMYGVTYGLLPACVLLLYTFGGVNISHAYYLLDYSNLGLIKIFVWMLFAFFGYQVVQFSYKVVLSRRFKRAKESVIIESKTHDRQEVRRDSKRIFSKLQMTMMICFVISTISLLLWTRAYGGIIKLIMIADKVRDGDSPVQNSIAFFARPAKMILISCYMSLVLVKNKYNRVANLVFFLASFALSILMLLAQDGRLGMAFFFATIVLLMQDYLKAGSFSLGKICKIFLLCIIALVGILNMDSFTFYIRNGYWENTVSNAILVKKFFLEFTYIFTGAQHSLTTLFEGECPYLIIHDILAGAFAWVPSSLRPDGIINVWNYNTELSTIGGTIYGQLPCDFITTSIYALGIFGPLVFGVFWGCVIKCLDCWHLRARNAASDIFYCAIAMRIFRIVDYCLLYDFILGSFSIVLAALIWWTCRHIRIKIR